MSSKPLQAPSQAQDSPADRPFAFDHSDYRDFFLAWLRYLKARQQTSVKAFALEADIEPATLVRVLKHWNPMTLLDFRKFLAKIELTSNEKEFLECLHTMSDATSQGVRLAALRKMLGFGEFRKRHPRDYEAWRYLSQWYYVAIREMALQNGFRADPHWIQSRLRKQVPLAEIRKALKFLEGMGFLKILPDGSVKPIEKEITCSGGVFQLVLGTFHRQMLDMAGEAIETVPARKRLLLGKTVTLPRSKYETVRDILENALETIGQLELSGDTSEDVYHLELALVPLTKGSETE